MNTFEQIGLKPGKGICYSGFRENQRPGGKIPSYQQVKEDLLILSDQWSYLRLYDCDPHTLTVLDVIKKEDLHFKILLGVFVNAEMNNFNCPWDGGVYSKKQLEKNRSENESKIARLIELANLHPDIIFGLSVGNEACVEWTDHYVHRDQILTYAIQVQENAVQPVTFCENYVPWLHKLDQLADALDFISIHTYPVWEYKHIDEAIIYTKENYYSVAGKYPDKAVIITEAGWATQSNGRGINPEFVNEEFQKIYFEKLMQWTGEENILTFFFEAFDEPWKGSPEPLEPEKHWGIYNLDRSPKLAMKK
ncbi:MAG TPA: hypothetical protein VKM37_06720 [Balneolaceae bacterium]|nr:hypothetical protein [Balneolaceae bacterium]